MWEARHPRGLGVLSSSTPWHDVTRRSGAAASASYGRPISRATHGHGSSTGRRSGSAGRSPITDPPRLAFLSKKALSDWVRPRAPRVESLCIAHTETRARPAGHTVLALHDLRPSDLGGLLSSLPSLTELTLHSASDLLPNPAALAGAAFTPGGDAAAAAAAGPDAAAAAAASDMLGLAAPPAPPPLPPFATRLQRLALRRTGYELRSEEGAAAAAALGRLTALRALELGLEPASSEGLSRLPDAWSALTGLTALRLSGHRALRRLPRWLPSRLPRLRELSLEDCGFRALPAPSLAGLRELRLLSLDRCPLGRADCAVSLDEWWPPPPAQAAEAVAEASAVAAPAVAADWGDGDSGDGCWGGGDSGGGWNGGEGAGASNGGGWADGGGGGFAWADRGGGGSKRGGGGSRADSERGDVHGGGGGVLGLEVLQLRECEIVALPYAITQLSRLERLELGGNPLGALSRPAGIEGSCGQLRASVLRYLRDSGDRGFELLASCPRLRHLGLEHCGLDRLPPALAQLGAQLTSLSLSHNDQLDFNLRDLPSMLPRLEHLRVLGTMVGDRLRQQGKRTDASGA